MTPKQVYIGLGANLNEPMQQLKWALAQLQQLPQSQLQAVSSLYGSKPLGPQDQPDYVNACALLSTTLSPDELLLALQQIELTSGRVRKAERWGARTLDLDILLIDQLELYSPNLTVPHYDMKNREFVLYPLLELNENLQMPDGTFIRELTNTVPLNGLTVLETINLATIESQIHTLKR